MKTILLILFIGLNIIVLAQQSPSIEIPAGVNYKYCDSATYEKAKTIITQELSSTPSYSLNAGIVFIGPVLWSRYKEVKTLKEIKGGDMTILGYKKETSSGKLTQNLEGFKLVWDYLRAEVADKGFKLRKATAAELKYFWSVISFDIDEPLIIVETANHNYIMNLSPKGLHLPGLMKHRDREMDFI